MHKIYFENRSVRICTQDEAGERDMETEILDSRDQERVLNALELFKSGDDGRSLILTGQNQEQAYKLVCSAFKEVNAAGGLVVDGNGKYLLIKRNSVWDLPKGHQEEGEDIVRTAVREVEEETGASGLVPEKLLCVTDHCYWRDGVCHLKHTWWYLMSCGSSLDLVPQTEEGITESVLVGKDELYALLECTYPSIREVFAAAAGKDETFIQNHRI